MVNSEKKEQHNNPNKLILIPFLPPLTVNNTLCNINFIVNPKIHHAVQAHLQLSVKFANCPN